MFRALSKPTCWTGVLATLAAIHCHEAAAQLALPSADAKTCMLLAPSDLEAALGATVTRQVGTDSSTYSSCTISAGTTASAKLEIHAPGQVGLPRDVASGLMAAKATIGEVMKDFETETLGDVGCYRGRLEVDQLGATSTTTCFLPAGYFVLTLTRPDALVPASTVKALLDKVAAAVR
jgi:hypothetical protein